MAVALPKPVTTATLLQKLELEEDAVGIFHFFSRHLSIPSADSVVV